jgi:hypothetical protein
MRQQAVSFWDVDHFPMPNLLDFYASASRRWGTKTGWLRVFVMVVGVRNSADFKNKLMDVMVYFNLQKKIG